MLLAALGLVVMAIGVSSTIAEAGHKDGHTTGPDCDKTPQATPCQQDNLPGNSGNTVACAGPAALHNPHCVPDDVGDDDDDDDISGDDDDDVTVADDDDDVGAAVEEEEAPAVLGVTETAAPEAAPEALAFTGSSTDSLALTGAGLMLLGLAAVAEGRLRRPHLVR